ncbi:MAG TPA: signal peptidase I [Actinomycetota bacterium]|nr:signal peptidase I [Actinomycetota bacterium]
MTRFRPRSKSVVSWTVFALLLAGWFFTLRPTFLGGPASYVMVSGKSMEPRLHTGDLVVAREAPEYQVGDVVAFRIPAREAGAGSMVIHRIIGGSGADGYTVQGDNRELPDPWHPTDEDVLGRMWFLIPQAANVLTMLRSPLGIAAVAAVLVFLIIALDRSGNEEAGDADDVDEVPLGDRSGSAPSAT